MNEVLDEIQSQVGADNLSNSCSRDGCRVSMEDVPSRRVVIDADRAFPAHQIEEGKQCDYILFFTNAGQDILFAVPMELKSGGVDASAVSEQLQQGAEFAARFVPTAFRTICHPVLFHGKSIHPKQRKTLNRAKVLFRGRQLTIKTARCNQPKNLARVLGDEVMKAFRV